jgi:hypothetical protein
MAGLLARGSLQPAAFPTCLLRDRHQWLRASTHRLQLRGQPWDCIGVLDAYHIPSSLFRSKEAIKGASTTLRRGVVNGPGRRCAPAEAARTIVAAGAMHYPGAVVRCSSTQGLAGETGSRCEQTWVLNPGAAPATVSESRRILKSLRPDKAWEDIRRPGAFASPETGLTSSSGYLRGGRIGPCYVTAIALAVARCRRAIQPPFSSPIPGRHRSLVRVCRPQAVGVQGERV